MQASDFEKKFPGKLVPTVLGSKAFLPDRLPPTTYRPSRAVRKLHDQALLCIGELRAIIPSLPNPELISRPFLRREAVLSSKIEGTHTEIEGLYLFETTKSDTPASEDSTEERKDAREVSNYVEALKFGIKQLETIPICNRLLKDMHRILLENVHHDRGLYKTPGEFRQIQAFIGSEEIHSARYVAPPAESVEDLMKSIEKYLNEDDDLPTLVGIAMVHYQFEAIHPFSDGNGRLGRLLIILMLIAKNLLPEPLLYISAYFERNKSTYVANLWQVSRCGAWEEWVTFFLTGVCEEAKDATKRAKKLLGLRESYRSQFQTDGCAANLLSLMDHLFEWPVTDVKRAKEFLNMTHQGASNNILALEQKGILREVTGNVRNRLWVARPIVDLMS